MQFRKTVPKREAPNNHRKENLVSDSPRKDRGTMSSTTDCVAPDHMLQATHSDHLSRSKLTLHNQRGTIPVMVGKTKLDCLEKIKLLVVSLLLPESKCICAECDKKEQSNNHGGQQGFLETNPLGFVQ